MRKENMGDSLERKENRKLAQQFEEMLRSHASCFFEHESFERIIEYYEERFEFVKAMEVVEHALSQYNYSSVFLIKKAQFLFEQQEFHAALMLLERAKVLSPSDLDIVVLESEILTALGKFGEAVDCLEYALQFADQYDRTDLYLAIADVYDEQDHEEGVFKYLLAALETQPNHPEILNRFDYCIEMTERYEESIQIHKEILEEDPYCYLAWYNLGNAYFGLELYEKAIDAYEYVTAIKEDYDLAYRDCGEAYYELGQYKQAKEQYLDALACAEADDELFYNIGLCCFQLGDYGTAYKHFKKTIHLNELHSNAYFQAGRCCYELMRWDEALSLFGKAIQQDSDNDRYLFVAGSLYFEMENYDMAAVLYHQAILKNSKEKAFWIALTQSYTALRLEDEAMSITDKALVEFENDPTVLYLKAACLFSFGKKHAGLSFFTQALLSDYHQKDLFFELMPTMVTNKDICMLVDQFAPVNTND